MTALLIDGIRELVTNDPAAGDGSPLGLITHAAVVVEAGRGSWVGPATAAPSADRRQNLGGRAVPPGFVDAHSHLVFAGDRSGEFTARMAGSTYDGGGIGTTVTATRAAADDELAALLSARVAELRRQGTTTIEIKSGYGLDVGDEE